MLFVNRLPKGPYYGVLAEFGTPAELAGYLKSETENWGKVVRATGARGE